MSERPKAYEGKEKYIFISYAHSDRERVYEVLYELENRGYRFWYDDGIAPGSEWAEDIAQHLNDAYLVIAFITKASVASDNCRREITYSLSKRKPFLSVILEETEMSAGLELQLSAQQSVIRQNFRNWDGFINKIRLNPDIAQCKAEMPAAEPEPAEVKPAAVREAIIPTETAAPVTEEVIPEISAGEELIPDAAAGAAETEAAAAYSADLPEDMASVIQSAAGAGLPETDSVLQEKGTKTKSRKPAKTLLFIAAVAAILVLGSVIISVTTTVHTSWGEDYGTGKDYSVSVESQTITQKDIEELCRMRDLGKIEFIGCDLSGCDLSVLTEQTKSTDGLNTIILDDCTGINDYSFLGDAEWNEVSLKNQSGFTDLSGINPAELITLNISGTGVSDISALSDLTNLSTLIARNTKITSIDALSEMSSLHEIDFSGCSIGKIGRHFNTLYLESIGLAGCGISDMSPFSDCTILKHLDISSNPELTDMSWLNPQNYPELQTLRLSRTGLDAENIQFITSCPDIKTLTLDGIQTDNLNFCRHKEQLKILSAAGCGLKDISDLKGCKALEKVTLCFNEITDITAFTAIDPSFGTEIDISCNKIKSLRGLLSGRYELLMIAGNDKKLADELTGEKQPRVLVADWYDGITDVNYANTYGIDDVYLIGTPADQKLNVEEAFTPTVHYITMDELYKQLLPADEPENSLYDDYEYISGLYEAWKASAESAEE